MRTLGWWCLVVAMAGCDGRILEPIAGSGVGAGAGAGAGGSGGAGAGITEPPPDVSCDTSAYPNVRLEAVAGTFASDIYPLMTSSTQGCAACHLQGMGRRLNMTADATETFYLIRQAGFFADQPGSMLDRLTTDVALAKMPQGRQSWTRAQNEAVAKIACQVRAFSEQGGAPIDESFPPNLLTAYSGPPNTDYDNSFINFLQLKARVKSVFNDTWVRGATDNFAASISLFGGVDYTTQFNEARVASADFLTGLDRLAPDVCGQAVANKTGPFAGLDLARSVVDVAAVSTQSFEAEASTATGEGGGALNGTVTSTGVACYSNCLITATTTIASPGQYTFTVRANGTYGTYAPKLLLTIGAGSLPADGGTGAPGVAQVQASTKGVMTDYTATITVTVSGMVPVSVAFTNDYGEPAADTVDRNVTIDKFSITGPNGGGGTANVAAAKAQIGTLYQRMLYRDATAAEQDSAYSLLSDVVGLSTLPSGWSAVCEALVFHPDFLFTVPPAVDTVTGAAKDKLLLVKLALDLVGRPPTPAEFAMIATGGKTFSQMVDTYLAMPEFQAYRFTRMRLRTESSGTALTDEAARLWTYLTVTGKPMEQLLTADYLVDEQWAEVSRPPEHGKSGVLTMKGYLNNKQGLPHFNFAARVFTGFMGMVFDVPPEVFAMRATATASSTVSPTSICFNCHQYLTPFSYQRTRWDDNGDYHATDPVTMQAIDDTDHALVDTYPFKGEGMEAFAVKAVKKEMFVRTMLQEQWVLLMGRPLRYDQDERDVYKTLWDLSFASNGDTRALIKSIALGKSYQRTP